MRYREIITEAIANKPRNLGLYVRNRIAGLKKVIALRDKAAEIITANERNGDRMLVQFLRYGSEDYDAANDITVALSTARRLENFRPYEHLLHNLESYLAHGQTFRGFVERSFDYAQPLHPEVDKSMAILDTAEKGAELYGYEPGNPENQHDEEFVAAMHLVEGLKMFQQAYQAGEGIWADVKHKIGLVARGPQRPEHDAVETLYHATAFVPEILREGFQAERPVDRRGLGNMGDVNKTVSFTHDLELARNLMRSLKEMWMIVHGQLTTKQIVSWIRVEGLETQVRGMFDSRVRNDPEFKSKESNLDSMNDLKQTIMLYRYWLAFSKLRADPVFVSPEQLIDIMKDRKLSDIGVLACQVEIDSNDEYLPAESEFRITPDRVISTKQVL